MILLLCFWFVLSQAYQHHSRSIKLPDGAPTYCPSFGTTQCFSQSACWNCNGDMILNISGCYCNAGKCTSCYQDFVSCGSLQGYCQRSKIGYPLVGLSCPYISGSSCNINECGCPYSYGTSYNGGWSVLCFAFINGTGPATTSVAAICSL